MTAAEFVEAEASMSRSPGSCNTMGTASTMASMAEALGMALSGNAAIPAVDSRRRMMAQLTGRRIVQMVKDDLKPSDILTREAFQNAIRTNAAIGGSTHAVIHLLAIAGRVGTDQKLNDWDAWGRDVPTIVNLMFAAILFGGLLVGRPLLKMLMGEALQLDDAGWRKFTLRWAFFFCFVAGLNEVVWRNFDESTWVTFKFVGIIGLTFIFLITQVPLLQRHRIVSADSSPTG